MSRHSPRRRWAASSGSGPLFRPGMPRRELAGGAGPQEGRAGQGWPVLGPDQVSAAAVESAGLQARRHTLEFVLCCAKTEEEFVFLATANKFAKSLIPCMCNFFLLFLCVLLERFLLCLFLSGSILSCTIPYVLEFMIRKVFSFVKT